MNKTVIWIAVAILVVVGIYWYMNQSGGASDSVVVALSTQNASGVSGTATLTETNGSTMVTLALTGSPADVPQPAHIHTGSCATIGGVVYPLEFPVNGASETTLNVTLEAILAQLPLALNVHKSAEEVSVYVACGDLVR